MASVVVMPKVGISVESCIITKWHKQKGDEVKEGELLFSYETDKASVDEESKISGTMLAQFYEEGDEVPVMQNVCVIGTKGEDISVFLKDGTEKAAVEQPEIKAAQTSSESTNAITAAAINDGGKIKASPRAKALAQKVGADLRLAAPSGPEGRIIERDVRAMIDSGLTFTKAAYDAISGVDIAGITGSGIGGKVTVSDILKPVVTPQVETFKPAPQAAFEAVKLPKIRKLIAKAMQNSLATTAQLTLNASFDATELMNYRASLKTSGAPLGIDTITINDMLLFAVARTLKNHRDLNANLIDDTMYYYNDVNLGVAVDTERGLLVPTLFAADKKTLSELSKQAKQLITESQKGNINPDLLKGGTFTVTNLGTLEVESFTPVINHPQTGILGVCAIVQKVKEVNGQLKMYPSMGLSLTFDHSAIDGAPAAKFLKELKSNLEHFNLLLAR
jgi:pyruvate dehydrogenase E2 component (dihydrolipoamide acetyltransferase)